MKHWRYAVTVEYTGVIEDDPDEPYGEDELQDAAIDSALGGFNRDRTVIDVEVEAIDNAGN
jgi:hypothetical protein